MYRSCTYFVYKVMMSVLTLYTSCMYKMYTKYVSCIQNVQKYVQNTYRLDFLVAGFLEAKPPPLTTQNGMFLSYNHHKKIKKWYFLFTKCIQTCFLSYKIVKKYDNYKLQCKSHVHIFASETTSVIGGGVPGRAWLLCHSGLLSNVISWLIALKQ